MKIAVVAGLPAKGNMKVQMHRALKNLGLPLKTREGTDCRAFSSINLKNKLFGGYHVDNHRMFYFLVQVNDCIVRTD